MISLEYFYVHRNYVPKLRLCRLVCSERFGHWTSVVAERLPTLSYKPPYKYTCIPLFRRRRPCTYRPKFLPINPGPVSIGSVSNCQTSSLNLWFSHRWCPDCGYLWFSSTRPPHGRNGKRGENTTFRRMKIHVFGKCLKRLIDGNRSCQEVSEAVNVSRRGVHVYRIIDGGNWFVSLNVKFMSNDQVTTWTGHPN